MHLSLPPTVSWYCQAKDCATQLCEAPAPSKGAPNLFSLENGDNNNNSRTRSLNIKLVQLLGIIEDHEA